MNARNLFPILLAISVAHSGCGAPSNSNKAASEKPAKVDRHVDEGSLNHVTLTSKAKERLGVVTVAVERVELQRRRTVGGDVMVPPDQLITVSAPLTGKILPIAKAAKIRPGTRVRRGAAIFGFQPMLTPERDVLTPAERVRVANVKAQVAIAQLEAERQVKQTALEVKAADIAFRRAKTLVDTKAGSQSSLDLADSALRIAQAAHETAKKRSTFLAKIQLDEQAGKLKDHVISTPIEGTIQSVDVAVGETVSAGEPLFRMANLQRLWIRVPIYVGQLRSFDSQAEAWVGEYGQPATAARRKAQYVVAPPSADPAATTVHLFFSLDNQQSIYHPGQRLAVTIATTKKQTRLVVPWKSVVYDIHGGGWVYVETKPLSYARQRVSVEYVAGDRAVLVSGPKPGTKVVTDGAAEIFGTEFPPGH